MSAETRADAPAPGRRTRPGHLPLVLALGVGLAYRLAAAVSFPVVFDEVQVVAYGFVRGSDPRLRSDPLFETPLAVSNGVTPLWQWIQALPAALFGEVSRAGLRSVPVLLGALGIVLAYRAGRRLATTRVAALAAFLYAVLDTLVYTNARGEFSESLLAVLCLLTLLDLMPAATERPVPSRAALWPALALLTYLGKGLLIWGAYSLHLGLLLLLGATGRARPRRLGLRRALALGLVPLVPALSWLVATNAAVFGGGGRLETDIGPVSSVWEFAGKLTFGYGSAVKGTLVATPRDALYLYLHPDIWPTTTLVFPVLLVTLAAAAFRLARALRRRSQETERWLLPLALVLPPAAVIVGRGVIDARFHLLYLPVLLPYAAECVDQAIRRLERASPSLGLSPVGTGRVAAGAFVLVLVASNLVRGPLHWGRHWAWEPSSAPGPPPREVTECPDPDLNLARCVLARHGVAAAVPYLRRAVDRHPDDRDVLLEAGGTLLGDRSQLGRIVELTSAYLRAHPEDERVRRLMNVALQRASRRAGR
jgi:uncharacterized membrane protein YqaE (UPF0057 family)